MFQSMPKVALAPLFVLWFGLGVTSKIVTAALVAFFPMMINTISEDYVAMAHAKGLPDRRVMTRYAARNAILPPLNGFAALFASAVGGLVFVEYVFSYPGVGLTLQQAVLGNDYALAQAILVTLSISVILANFIVDILNLVLDPRLRQS